MMPDDERTLHEWPKNGREVIRATVKTYKGKRYVSLRLYYRNEEAGEFYPTKKGLTLAVVHVPDLVSAIRKLEEAAKHDGDDAA